ncbi:MAG: amidophosphoribosyltransferase [Nitrospirae bacterium]|nr:amidophosphoribosyltransferase [Nitrospirota bacterium]
MILNAIKASCASSEEIGEALNNFDVSEDKFREECGVFGVFNHIEAANLTYLGLYALQHRGQEGAGICSSDGKMLHLEKSMGLVADVFSERRIQRLKGQMAIGHNRYSTAGSSSLKNVQPILVNYSLGQLAIAHNGNLINAAEIRRELEAEGAIFQSDSDSEVIVHLIAHARCGNLHDRIIEAVRRISGAFSLILMTANEMIVVRDTHGFRPLALGTHDGAWVVGSETCAFDLIGAEYIRDIDPGEMLVINEDGVKSIQYANPARLSHCIFEFIYFSRPDSNIFGNLNVNELRKEFGRKLARDHAVEADIVIPVPDSGVPAALGYAEQAGIPFDFGLIRNHYVGRTFIEPQQSIRHFGVKIKLNPIRKLLEGKRVVVVDDSIVRGTTSKKIVKMIRESGCAKSVHLRISSPPTVGPCYYGIDTPTRNELIASTHSVEEIRKYVTADSLGYLNTDELREVVPNCGNYCMACFDNRYPLPFPNDRLFQHTLF